ncbi:MAG: ComEC/Rec2 family competence protein, partial [Pseudomonadota bacterium]
MPLTPGLSIMTTGHLSPPGGPVEPGGFDFRRHAWFQGLGAVGYTRVPVVARAPPAAGDGLWLVGFRMSLSAALRERVPGGAGAFIAVIVAGDRSALPRDDIEALRHANLAHLLAISDLHMGLLTGTVFFALRAGLAVIPGLALHWPIRKVAAVGALLAGAFYLALSGGNVATVRAFVMATVVLGAILVERRAFSFRTLAVAATLILVMSPEALTGPGFQMSFAATLGLIAVFGLIRDRGWTLSWPRWAAGAFAVVVSSAVAGAATAPFGAAHFNTVSDYGLLANLLSVPLMGLLVMPAALIAFVLWPFGAEWLPLWVMQQGVAWILFVAHWVAGHDGAVTRVPAPPPLVLPVFSLGALVVVLWQGAGRWLGLVPIAFAVLAWTTAERPFVLVSESG